MFSIVVLTQAHNRFLHRRTPGGGVRYGAGPRSVGSWSSRAATAAGRTGPAAVAHSAGRGAYGIAAYDIYHRARSGRRRPDWAFASD